MRKAILIPIIIGSILLTIGGGIFIMSLANGSKAPLVEKEYAVEDFSNINIDIDTAHLEFKPSQDGERKVVVKEREKHYHEVEVVDNTLKIKSYNKFKWYQRIFNIGWKNMSVTLYAPAGEYQNALIKSSTGNITIPHDFSFNSLKVDLSTGDLKVQSDVTNNMELYASTGDINVTTKCKNLATKTSTGHITLSDTVVSESLIAGASTGRVKVLNSSAKNTTINTSTGDITLTNVLTEEHLGIKASTGDVKITDSDAATIDIETSTGDVDAILLSGKTFSIKTKTGKMDCPDSLVGAGLCKVKTTTGHIIIKIKQ